MPRTAAFKYEIIRDMDTRKPQIARVYFDDGTSADFTFGHYLSERRIVEMLPRVVMDSKKKYGKRALMARRNSKQTRYDNLSQRAKQKLEKRKKYANSRRMDAIGRSSCLIR